VELLFFAYCYAAGEHVARVIDEAVITLMKN
jgi:hypothetical protein